MFRRIGAEDHPTPTLLFDEIDAIFGPKAGEKEDLRGLLNAGYRRGVRVHRMGGPKMTTLEEFEVFCAKVFAGIGDLPDTIADRSIRIRLVRKTRGEVTDRFRRRDVVPDADLLRERVTRWARPAVDRLRDARPSLPDELDDRAQDVWEPLLAIADVAGPEWGTRARLAAVSLSSGEQREEDSLGIRLLGDVRRAFDQRGVDRFATAELIAALATDEESPWADWHGRGSIPPKSLATILRPYGIRSRTIRLDTGDTPKGFHREQFEDAWNRFVPLPDDISRHTATTRMAAGIEPIFDPPQNGHVADGKMSANPHGYASVADVAAKTADNAPGGENEPLQAAFDEDIPW